MVSVSALGLGLGLSAAQAADVIAPEPVANWTGFHIGAGGGVGYNTYDAESEFYKDVDTGDGGDIFSEYFLGIRGDDLGKWYGFGTVELGFDFQFDNSPLLIGILGNYDFNGKGRAEAETLTGEPDGDYSYSYIGAQLDDSWFVGGRVGFIMQESTLLYALAGYTWADGKVEAYHEFEDNDEDDAALFTDKKDVGGFTVGGGIEHLLTDNISVKVEYRHDFLDDIKWSQAAFDPQWGIDDDNLHRGKVKFGRDTVRAVLSWRFNMFQ
jgi:outer membrane immunogenic protein